MSDIHTTSATGTPLTLHVSDILAVQGGSLVLNRGGEVTHAPQGAGVLTRYGFVDLDPLAIGGLLLDLKVLGYW